MKSKLYLDDYRFPEHSADTMWRRIKKDNIIYIEQNWNIVRSFKEFKNYIICNPIPNIISLDYDLDEYEYYVENTTGYDCLIFLLEYCKLKKHKIPKIIIHSANPVASYYLAFIRDLGIYYNNKIKKYPSIHEWYDNSNTLMNETFNYTTWEFDISNAYEFINKYVTFFD